MPDQPSTPPSASNPPQPEPAPGPGPKRGEINRATLDDIALADKCAAAASEDDNTATLQQRAWTSQNQTDLTAAVAQAEDFVRQIKAARAGKRTRTQDETAAREELLAALDPILTGAKRTFPDGAGERTLFGVGENIANHTTHDLWRLARDTHKNLTPGKADDGTSKPPAYTLKGVQPDEIAALGTLAQKYKDADFAQADTGLTAAELLDQLNKLMDETLNPLRRDLQLTADQAWPYRESTNRSKRMAFGLPANRPVTE
jgi:hypothetical protein